MRNFRMAELIKKGEALDVDKVGVSLGNGVWELSGYFWQDAELCVVETEEWIKSVGKSNADGRIYASVDNRYYKNPDYACLFLRI
jgi:hypothetical protein